MQVYGLVETHCLLLINKKTDHKPFLLNYCYKVWISIFKVKMFYLYKCHLNIILRFQMRATILKAKYYRRHLWLHISNNVSTTIFAAATSGTHCLKAVSHKRKLEKDSLRHNCWFFWKIISLSLQIKTKKTDAIWKDHPFLKGFFSDIFCGCN